jgi:hypothetical protein
MLIPWIAAGWRPSRFCTDARTRNSTPWRGVASEREFAVLASGRRTASVVATSSVQVIAFFKPDVWGLERDAPEAARRLRAAMDAHLGSSPGSSSDE